MPKSSTCRFLAGIFATISLQAAHAALLQDVELDNAGAVRRAIDSGEATPNSLAGEPGIPILAVAARAGSIEVVRLLIMRRVDLDARTPLGETALMLASFVPDGSGENGAPVRPVHAEVVRVLVEAGASLENPGNLTAVSYAAYAGHLDVLRYLLDRKASPDGGAAGDAHRFPTPLMMAVMKGNTNAARLLLERGANPRIKGPAGADAVDFARKLNRTDLIPLLDCAAGLAPGERFAERCVRR